MKNKDFETTFKPYSGSMDFPSIFTYIVAQKEAAEKVAEKALNDGFSKEEAVTLITLMNKAATTLKSTVAVFIEMHKDVSSKEKKTLTDAIKGLEGTSNKLKYSNILK